MDSLQQWMKGQDTSPTMSTITCWYDKVKRFKVFQDSHNYQYNFIPLLNHRMT